MAQIGDVLSSVTQSVTQLATAPLKKLKGGGSSSQASASAGGGQGGGSSDPMNMLSSVVDLGLGALAL